MATVANVASSKCFLNVQTWNVLSSCNEIMKNGNGERIASECFSFSQKSLHINYQYLFSCLKIKKLLPVNNSYFSFQRFFHLEISGIDFSFQQHHVNWNRLLLFSWLFQLLYKDISIFSRSSKHSCLFILIFHSQKKSHCVKSHRAKIYKSVEKKRPLKKCMN